MILTLLIFLAILLVLIISHELGHFWAARAFGIKVEEFGFGIPPRILSLWRDKKGTLYSLNLLPFGGFVKIEDEEKNANAYVLLAGVLANILLAYLVFSFIAWAGVPQVIAEEERNLYPEAKITIIDLAPDAPAAKAGITIGDQIIGFQKIEDLQNFIKQNQGRNINLSILRGETELKINALPRANPPTGEGPLGVALGYFHLQKSAWYLAPIDGAAFTLRALKATVIGLWELIKSLFIKTGPPVEVSGPVGIFNITSSAKSLGLNFLLLLLASLSINLALINILPFPGLDGGRLLFVLIEAVRGKRISSKTSAFVHSIGLAVLIALMLAVTYHDIAKIF